MKYGKMTIAVVTLLVTAVGFAAAEQLTTVAIFSSDDVVREFFVESQAFREFRRFEEEQQTEIAETQETLRSLQASLTSAISRNNNTTAERIRGQIQEQQEYLLALRTSYDQRYDEIVAEMGDDAFVTRLNDVVRYIAEDHGYTIVMDASIAVHSGVFWWSPEVDITRLVLEEMQRRFQ